MNTSNQLSVLAADLDLCHKQSQKPGMSDVDQHQSFVCLLNDVGICHFRNGKVGEAVRCFRSAWEHVVNGPSLKSSFSEKIHAPSVPSVQCENVMSDENKTIKSLYVYQRDEYDEGMHAYSQPIHIDYDCMDNAQIMAAILYNLGQGLVQQGAYEEALGWFHASHREIKGIRHRCFSAINVVAIHHNLGHCTYRLEALEVYVEALRIRRLLLGDNMDVAATIYNTGQTHHQMGNHDLAMSLYQEFLQIATRRLGSEHRDVAIIYKCIAQIHHERKEFDIAMEMFLKALKAGRAALGDVHPEIASTLNKIETYRLNLAIWRMPWHTMRKAFGLRQPFGTRPSAHYCHHDKHCSNLQATKSLAIRIGAI
ncbi:TPR repeat [Fragilaria crotonensis]|nr:TPR repeat [Fragilaria crotonensis]